MKQWSMTHLVLDIKIFLCAEQEPVEVVRTRRNFMNSSRKKKKKKRKKSIRETVMLYVIVV